MIRKAALRKIPEKMRIWSGLLPGFVMAICAGCASTTSAVSSRNVSHELKCVGLTFDRHACIQMAAQICPTGAEIYEKELPGEDGVVRTGLYYKCRP